MHLYKLSRVKWVAGCCSETSGKVSRVEEAVRVLCAEPRGCNANLAVTHHKWLRPIPLEGGPQTICHLLGLGIRRVWKGSWVPVGATDLTGPWGAFLVLLKIRELTAADLNIHLLTPMRDNSRNWKQGREVVPLLEGQREGDMLVMVHGVSFYGG